MSVLRCPGCGAERPPDVRVFECACGELLELDHGAVECSRELFDVRRREVGSGLRSGVWRFREVVHPDLPEDETVRLGEGDTPLYDSAPLARWCGLERIAIKHEGMNPSGSFKDRGMTVAVSHARRLGARRVACASTGNTAASLASYAAAAGLQAVVLAPEDGTAAGKLSQAIAYGARTLLVRGDFDAGMRLVRASAEELGLYLVNSINPFRLEGQKTIVLELLQELGWRAPDWIVFPAGNLGNCAAFGKALKEARARGWIDRMPRLAAVQARGASPFAAAFEGGQFSTLEEDDVLKSHAFEKGDLLLFLSHKYHCVAPVDAGERRVFVAEIWEGEARDCAGRCVQPAGAVCVSCGAFTGTRE